jgi:hypothetical protein
MSPIDRGRLVVALAVALTGTVIALTGTAISAPGASAASACVDQILSYDPGTYQPCALDEQVLLDDLWRIGFTGPDQQLATDGYYGLHTEGDVESFNDNWIPQQAGSGVTTTYTWAALCELDWEHGFRGAYWHNAGCTP